MLISHFDWQVRVLILKINYCFSQRGTWLVLHCDPEYALFAQQGSPGCLKWECYPGAVAQGLTSSSACRETPQSVLQSTAHKGLRGCVICCTLLGYSSPQGRLLGAA